MSSIEREYDLTDAESAAVVDVARRAIERAVAAGAPLDVDASDFPAPLRGQAATFVTVERKGELLGCIGSIRAHLPLVEDVAKNAAGAILHDPRCPTLRPSDVPDLEIHVSLLTPPRPMTFSSEEDLISQLRPGVDGLLLEEGFNRGTFLPVVWESLPDPRDFLAHLKTKAGLPQTYWSDTVRVSRYTTEVVHGA